MGRDKGLIMQDGTPWALHMADKLVSFQLPVLFSINQRQWDAYCAMISPDQLVVDALDLPGPLSGILSVHQRFPDMDILLLACDMLDLDTGTIRKLIDAYAVGGSFDCFVYQDARFAQPFCGIYTAPALSLAAARILQGSRNDLSLQQLIRGGKTKRLPIDRREAFTNYNSL